MQFFILLLGAIVFMFYQFEKPPVYFNQPAYQRAMESGYAPQLTQLQTQSDEVFTQKRAAIRALSTASSSESDAMTNKLRKLDAEAHELRDQTKSSRASGRGSEEQGIRLRVHHFYSSTDAAWNCRITHRRDFVRDHVRNGSNSKRSRVYHRNRLLSAVDPAERNDHHYV